MKRTGFSQLSEDVMQNIFSRLPASAFSSAACVSKCWNIVCRRILTKPKFASALSLKPTLPDAAKEVLDKVLSEPIVPHFAIACIGNEFSLPATHELLTQKLGSRVPLITHTASGIIGADVTNNLQEVRWKSIDDDEDDDDSDSNGDSLLDRGIVLVIGFVPGLKVDAIPLLRTMTVPQIYLDGNFLMDIKDFTASFSDSESPAGIILFGVSCDSSTYTDRNIDMRLIMARMVYIGVVQHRQYPCGPGSFISRASLAFYEVLGAERHFLIVNGVGIKSGDPFLFYHSDSDTASSSCSGAYSDLATLKEESGLSCLPLRNGAPSSGEKEVFGGLIFSSYLRGETSNLNVESSPFHENFPEVPLAGVFCNGEIGRGSSSSISQEDDQANYARCCLHYHSTIYLVLSYTPPTSEH
ncbi:F-box/LRR-repeat protein At5g63520-like [Euphorbia lathyris]|uniref:F-box/LRR-repeat protein At5g63520-like n=1 Tax=Euphorbia lathyris TaxID=212925 RepID=UPI0033136DB1